MATESVDATVTGSCLCGSVQYEVTGLRDIIFCHCENCRRTHGNFSAYSSAARADLQITERRTLRWYHTDKDVTTNVWRGFCSECGSPDVAWRLPDGDPVPREVCRACGAIHYRNPQVVVGCPATWEARVPLCRRPTPPPPRRCDIHDIV